MFFRIENCYRQNIKIPADNVFSAFVAWVHYFEGDITSITVTPITEEEYNQVELTFLFLGKAPIQKEDKFSQELLVKVSERHVCRCSPENFIPAYSIKDAVTTFLSNQGIDTYSEIGLSFSIFSMSALKGTSFGKLVLANKD